MVLPVFRFLPVCVVHGSKNRFVLKKNKKPVFTGDISTIRSKKNEKPVFTGDISTNARPAELEASSMAESQEKFVANPKRKAPIWEFFRFRCKDVQVDSTKAYCTECKASVKLEDVVLQTCRHMFAATTRYS